MTRTLDRSERIASSPIAADAGKLRQGFQPLSYTRSIIVRPSEEIANCLVNGVSTSGFDWSKVLMSVTAPHVPRCKVVLHQQSDGVGSR
ncbi:hypothetical protein [Tahibacter amnicola]|uniref:Uncharacterized protein n=1 Tax=Tahibacter amnicola TaxID=2976241 RepID=A0ABY6BE80_9GAMM|nr:hypothetical protein [Tahibacter amnicola]UXI66926.1 hypothetical protein N4264_19530 [Tahibacter amnicola]